MDKVYVVTQGNYSDYHICGIFDSRELAEQYISMFSASRYNQMEMESFPLNPLKQEIGEGYSAYSVKMRRDGGVDQIEKEDNSYGFQENKFADQDGDSIWNYCFAKDEVHAIKITNEKRVQLIAENKWRIK